MPNAMNGAYPAPNILIIMAGQLAALVLRDWDPAAVHANILASQKRRLFLAGVARKTGCAPNWAYQARTDDSQLYVRGGGAAGPTSVKARARYPFVPAVQPDHGE